MNFGMERRENNVIVKMIVTTDKVLSKSNTDFDKEADYSV